MKPNHITAKKHFSQNFLVDPQARAKVLAGMKQICDLQNLPILEIGPGQGDVTKEAVKWNKKLIAIEIDPEAVQYLQDEIVDGNFELIHADVMDIFGELLNGIKRDSKENQISKSNFPETDKAKDRLPRFARNDDSSLEQNTNKTFARNDEQLEGFNQSETETQSPEIFRYAQDNNPQNKQIRNDDRPERMDDENKRQTSFPLDSTKFKNLPANFSLISSLPYHIGSRLLVDLAVLFPHINFGVIHQKEVVLKTQSNSNFTFFGAWLCLFWNCKYCFDLPKHCFSPQPKIVSAFLQGYSKNSQDLAWLKTQQQRQQAKNTLKKLFSFPNKTLVNNLKQLDWNPQKILEFVDKYCNSDQNTRLGWSNYQQILEAIILDSDQQIAPS
jgi:16S rRNA A1518/A1519 N6-dimethyltransferase RsmA/KsgA/DIM1 with predicted DNA glycosylase/AP lyase activity